MKKKKIHKNTNNDSDQRYHGPLIQNPASLAYLKIFPWLNLPFCSFFFYLTKETPSKIGIFSSIFLVCLVVNVFILFLGLFNCFINRFKVVSYILVALGMLITLLWLDFMWLLMVIYDGTPVNASVIYQSPLTPYYVIFNSLLFIAAIALYSWYYLPKNQGKVWAFNQEKSGSKQQKWFSNFGVAFAGAVFVPAFLTGYIQNIFGLFLGILLTTTLPAVIVDAIYAAYYVRKHHDSEELF